jgi:hypothetical protein
MHSFLCLNIWPNLCQFWNAGQLRRLPISYIEGIKYLLDLWFDDINPGDNLGGATGRGPGTGNTSDPSALDSGDVEMCTDSTERSDTTDKTDPLMGLAIHLKLISPESPLLSAEDRQDLALLDQLTQSQSRLQQVLGLETEIAVTEKWNFDAVVQLLDLANNISDIPFASGTELLALEPSSAAESGPPGMSSKGKGCQEEAHKTRSNDKPYVAGSEWADSIGELCLSLGPMQLLTPGKSIRYLRCWSALTSKISIVFFL